MSTVSKDLRTEKATPQATPRRSPYPPLPALPRESRLVSFGDRVTYTFAYGKEVGSIHFDRGRGEIFYKGHNIRHMELEEWQMQMMEKLRVILQGDAQGRSFAEAYGHTLDKVVLEKKNASK